MGEHDLHLGFAFFPGMHLGFPFIIIYHYGYLIQNKVYISKTYLLLEHGVRALFDLYDKCRGWKYITQDVF